MSKPYTVAWEGEVHADNPVEAAELALAQLRDEKIAAIFEVDGREVNLDDPPMCTAQIFAGSRIDPPEYCDAVAMRWDEHDDGWCDAHGAQPDPFDGKDI
jgi:hypothetical protein